MKVVYHEKYGMVYSSDPASAHGRMESICRELQAYFEFVEPKPASEKDLFIILWTISYVIMQTKEQKTVKN